MKKAILRKLREKCEKVLGKEKTDKIIEDTVKKVLDETKPKENKKESEE